MNSRHDKAIKRRLRQRANRKCKPLKDKGKAEVEKSISVKVRFKRLEFCPLGNGVTLAEYSGLLLRMDDEMLQLADGSEFVRNEIIELEYL